MIRVYGAGANPPWKRIAVIAFALLASADPLNQAYIRFWLSDAPAAAAFVAFVALVSSLASPRARIVRLLPAIAGCVLVSIFVRVAYAPIEFATLLIATGCARGPEERRLRRRLLLLAALPILALGALAAANSRVAIPSLRGEFFVNRMSSLYTMGVFLPALRQDDFARAGVPLTKTEFDALNLGDYDARELQIWADGPRYVRWLLEQKLDVDQISDARFEATCAAVVRSALLHHPQTMVATYLVSLAIQFSPSRWSGGFSAETGFGRNLPEWATKDLTRITGRTISPSITSQRSAASAVLGPMIWLYPYLLIAGAVAAVVTLIGARPFGGRHVVAAAVLAALLLTPLFSHAVKPRYYLATVTLADLLLPLSLCRSSTRRWLLARATALWRAIPTPMLPAAVATACILVFAGQLGLGTLADGRIHVVRRFTHPRSVRAGAATVLLPATVLRSRAVPIRQLGQCGRPAADRDVPGVALGRRDRHRRAGGVVRSAAVASPIGDRVGPGRGIFRVRPRHRRAHRTVLLADVGGRLSPVGRKRPRSAVPALTAAGCATTAWMRRRPARCRHEQRDGSVPGDRVRRGGCRRADHARAPTPRDDRRDAVVDRARAARPRRADLHRAGA